MTLGSLSEAYFSSSGAPCKNACERGGLCRPHWFKKFGHEWQWINPTNRFANGVMCVYCRTERPLYKVEMEECQGRMRRQSKLADQLALQASRKREVA